MIAIERSPRRQCAVRSLFAAAGTVGYLVLVYLFNRPLSGPHALLWQEEIWNYGSVAVMMAIIYLLTTRNVDRPRPTLPTDAKAGWWLLGLIGLAAVFNTCSGRLFTRGPTLPTT